MKTIKNILRQNSGWGELTDKWDEAMNLFFSIAALTYELGETPEYWGYRTGSLGNVLPLDEWYYEEICYMTYDELVITGNYLYRLTTALENVQ